MPEKKSWTEEEDKILRFLFEVEKVPKWSKIAQKMADDYHMTGRNGKQCRERYCILYIDTKVYYSLVSFIRNGHNNKKKSCICCMMRWETNGHKLLKKCQEGISSKDHRTDNCVKNHFYSNLRKAIRKLNKVIA